ncbi:probable glutathione S-transferase [Carica papaya]|uniref:probable glutathione S-transferase n=1 Tax=Carica papaya TaxID=3649 RepID=UPI000B8CC243|nr:probable glutathione S-transferase [Carica papaya]
MSEEVKLLGHKASPFTCRVIIALKMKGIPYDYIEEDTSNKSPLLLKSNPVHKKIPVLIHNGKPIAESLVIVEYIDETWKQNPILHQDPYDRAMARFWAKYIDEKCMMTLWTAYWSEENGREKAVEEANECLRTMENEVKGKRFFGGEKIGMVDIAACFFGLWVEVIQEIRGLELLTAEKFPRLFEWSQGFVNCDLIKQCLPERENLAAIFKARYGSRTTSTAPSSTQEAQ